MGERRRNDSGNLIPDRVAKAFSVAYGEPIQGGGSRCCGRYWAEAHRARAAGASRIWRGSPDANDGRPGGRAS